MLIRPVSVAIVDDHVLFRKTLRNYLSDQKAIQVPLLASDLTELLSKLKDISVDILLMDLFMPGLNSTEGIRAIRSEYPSIKILVLSISTDMNLISDLLDCGIHGYVSKADEPEELLQAIQAAAENRICRNKLFTEALYWNKQNTVNTCFDSSNATLNEREKKILRLLWEEKSNKEIADELFLGIRTVERIRQDLKEKIGAKSTVGLLKFAINKKIIQEQFLQPPAFLRKSRHKMA